MSTIPVVLYRRTLSARGGWSHQAEIFTGQVLRRENDLAGVLREVFDHVQDGFDSGGLAVLNLVDAGQLFSGQAQDHRGGLVDYVAQVPDQFGRRLSRRLG